MAEQYKISVVIDGQDQITSTLDKVGRKVKETGEAAEDAAKKTKSFGQQWGDFKNQAQSFLGAAGLVGAALYKINEAGAEVTKIETTFDAVSGGANGAASSLAHLRDITGGVITDLELMRGANSLLVTGIASTNDQAAELVNLGARLSSAMGVDAAEGIQNLNSALLNNSFLRLDTLGISASAVRERVNELKEAGLDMSAAFSQAVVEIGTQTLSDLGAAASTSETAVNRLSVSFQNLANEGLQFAAQQFETAATSFEQLLFLLDHASGATVEQQNIVASQIALITKINETRAALEGISGGVVAQSILNPEFSQAVMSGDVAGLLEEGMSVQEIEILFKLQPGQLDAISQEVNGTVLEFSNSIAQGFESVALDNIVDQFEAVERELNRVDYQAKAVTVSNAALNNVLNGVLDSIMNAPTPIERYYLGLERVALHSKAAEVATAGLTNVFAVVEEDVNHLDMVIENAFSNVTANINLNSQLEEITFGFRNLESVFEEGSFGRGGISFFDPDALSEVQGRASALMDEYERLKDLQETSPELVTDAQVARAEEIANSAADFANQAERGADAFQNATLAQITGLEMTNQILSDISAQALAGIEDETLRAEAERAVEFKTGERNVLSTGIEEQIAPTLALIAESFGPEAYAQAAERVQEALSEGARLGLSEAEILINAQVATGFQMGGGGGQDVTVQAGEGAIAVAQRTGFTREEIEAASGGQMLLAGQVLHVGDGTSLIPIEGGVADASELIGGTGEVLGGALDEVQFFLDDFNQIMADASAEAAQTASNSWLENTIGGFTSGISMGAPEIAQGAGAAPTSEMEEISERAASMREDVYLIETSLDVATEKMGVIEQITGSVSQGFMDIGSALVGETLDPLIADLDTADNRVTAMTNALMRIPELDLGITIPATVALDAVSAEWLSRNPTIIQGVTLILNQLGLKAQ